MNSPAPLAFPTVLDSSMLATYKRCPWMFRLQYLEGWHGKLPSVHLHAGGAFAHGVERTRRAYYVEGERADIAVAQGRDALGEFYGDFACPADSAKSLDRMRGAFDFYWDNYPLAEREGEGAPIILPSGARGIEFSFALPLPLAHPMSGDPLLYCGRADAIINFAGTAFLVDEKTTSSLGSQWARKWTLRSQFTGYCLGARQSGIDVAGTLVRGVSILKTKYETQQAVVYSPQWQVDRWYDELLTTVGEMIERWATGRWTHNLDDACADYGGCQFLEACSAQDPQPWLATAFEQRWWQPISRTYLRNEAQ